MEATRKVKISTPKVSPNSKTDLDKSQASMEFLDRLEELIYKLELIIGSCEKVVKPNLSKGKSI